MNIDRAAFLFLTAALGCAPAPADDAEVAEAEQSSGAVSSCTPKDLLHPYAFVDEKVQGFRAPAPVSEGWDDEVPLAQYYDQLIGRFTSTSQGRYRELTFTAVRKPFPATNRSAFEVRAIDQAGTTWRWVYWLSYAPSREAVVLTIADPTWVNPPSSGSDHCKPDGACKAARVEGVLGTSFAPEYVGPRQAKLMPNGEIAIYGAFFGKRAGCEDPKPPYRRD